MTRKKASNERSGRTKLHRWLIVACILVAIFLGGWYLLQPRGSKMDFSLVDIDGNPFQLNDFRGKVVLLDFMATSCGPCQASVPKLLSIHEEYGDEVVIISISVDPTDTKERLRSWMEGWGSHWIHARDIADPPVSQLFDVRGIPTFILVDKSGEVGYRHIGLGPNTETTLKNEISELLG